MRRIGLALLVVSAGCNQLFGIKDTDRQPDAPPLTYAGKMQWAAAGATDGAIDVFPIGSEAVDSEPPHIQIGPMLGMGDLVDAPYDTMTGEFQFGFMLAGQPWRLVYTLPGDTVTHELQWTVKTPDLVVPRMTRKGLTPPPSGSGYHVMAPNPFSLPLVATSGAYTSSFAASDDYSANANDLMYPFPERARPILGPLAAPAASDWVLTLDWAAISADLLQVGGWSIATNAPLMPGALTDITPPWRTGPMITVKPTPGANGARNRIQAALGALADDDSTGLPLPFAQHMTYGLTPNTGIYGFAPGAPDCGTPQSAAELSGIDCLGSPALIPLADDRKFDISFQIPGLDASMIPNLPVMYARVSQARTVHGVALTSAIQSLVLAPNPPTANESIAVLSSTVATAALVDQIKLDTFELSATAPPVTPDVVVTATSGPRLLTFHPRLGADNAPLTRADDFVITLYKIQDPDTSTAKLHTVRVYHVIDHSAGVAIDGALLPPGLYVFAITSRIGYQNAANGDFRTVHYPLGESTAFSRQFVVQ
jgi:hypothetical protein